MASQDNEIDHVVAMTYTMYLFFLNELKKRKMLGKDFPLRRFNKLWKDEFDAPINKKTRT